VELEKLFSKNQLIERLRHEFTSCKDVNFPEYIVAKGIPIKFGIDILVQMALHKRCDLKTLVGTLRHHFNDGQLTCDMILKAAMADLLDWSPQLKQFVVKFTISADVQEELDRFQFPLPMVVPPLKVGTNKDTGYYLGGNSGSIILKKNHHNDDVCLDHINRLNAMKFVINNTVALMVKNKWRGLGKVKDGETREDFEKRKRQFEKYDRTAKDVMDTLRKHSDEFYLTHRYDKRGRSYCQGYHVNYQGTPWNKAVVELAEQEHVNG
jgi:hypothetical protein